MPNTTRAKTRPLTSTRTKAVERTDKLKRGLLERRSELQNDLEDRMRHSRLLRTQEGTDDLEHSEAATQNDLAIALLQMRSEALADIDVALARLDGGRYGLCATCKREIAIRRLRALPFAVRCQPCEIAREDLHRKARYPTQGRGSLERFPETARTS